MTVVDISVIIVNYNTFQLTYNCVKSLKKFTQNVSYETIIVDNNSIEDITSINEHFKDIILIKNKENVGFAAANNIGIVNAKGKYILLLNSDTELLNNAVKIAYDKILTDNKIGALTVKLFYPDKKIQYVANRFPSILNNLYILFRIDKIFTNRKKSNIFLGYHFDHLSEKKVDWIWGAFFMIKKGIIENTFPNGLLHQTFFMYGEDVQWCYHIKKSGLKIVYDPRGEVLHYIGGSDKTDEGYFKKYFGTILKNQFILWKEEKGRLWTFFYFLSKGLLHFSMRDKKNFREGLVWAKYAFKSIYL